MTIPFNPDNFDRVFVSFSGGKDSVATFIKVREVFPLWKIVLIFTDTGHEMPETYQYLEWFDKTVFPVIRLVTRVPDKLADRRQHENIVLSWKVSVEQFDEMKILTIFDTIRHRYQHNSTVPPWPSGGIRFCTRDLKINPFFKYVRGLVSKENREKLLICKGLRREESKARIDTPEFVIDEVNGDFYSVWHPVYNLITEEIFQLHRDNDIRINPVYAIRERSNCVGCPFARNHEIRETLKVYPNILNKYIEIENETGYTWKKAYSLKDIVQDDTREEEELSCLSGYCDI